MRVGRVDVAPSVRVPPAMPTSNPQRVYPHLARDSYAPDRIGTLRRAIEKLERRIAVKTESIGEARGRRTLARRLTIVMSAATIISSVVSLVLVAGPLAPVAAAIWVVPAALGGSAVSQSVLAMRESNYIARCELELVGMREALEQLRTELKLIEIWRR